MEMAKKCCKAPCENYPGGIEEIIKISFQGCLSLERDLKPDSLKGSVEYLNSTYITGYVLRGNRH
jgi:hypothetical protein